ncbi:Mss4-like protein [Mycena floridula]|nr:Mss4-like protein [Mycena floridula]
MAAVLQWSVDGVETQKYTGHCHCGKFAYNFEHPALDKIIPTACNCSICSQRGYFLVYVPAERFNFTSGSWDELSGHSWATEIVKHKFCPSCGSAIGVRINAPTVEIVAVNLRTVEGLTRESLEEMKVLRLDGRSILLSDDKIMQVL